MGLSIQAYIPQSSTHPGSLIDLPLLRHFVTDVIGVPKRPHRQLVQDTKFQEHVELGELVWLLLVPKRVLHMRCFRIVLTARVFVEIIEPIATSLLAFPRTAHTVQGKEAYVRPRWDDTHLSKQRPISINFSDGPVLRHSFSKSCVKILPLATGTRERLSNPPEIHQVSISVHTSTSKSSSIFMSFPKMVINCMRFANSQQFRRRWSKPGSSGWAGVDGADGAGSTLERERFRETISAEGRRKARWRIWRLPFLPLFRAFFFYYYFILFFDWR